MANLLPENILKDLRYVVLSEEDVDLSLMKSIGRKIDLGLCLLQQLTTC